MRDRETSLPPELEAFIEPRRLTRRLPAETRARVLARASQRGVAGRLLPPAHLHDRGDSPAPVRARSLARLAVAASVVLAAGTVWGIVSFPRQPAVEVRPDVRPAVQPATSAAPHVQAAPAVTIPAAPLPPTAAPSAAIEAPAHRPRPAAPRDAFAVELELLQRAHTDYTHRDLPGALALLAEHARRFPNGRLAEEREALRVRALLAAGRNAEAHRVAAAFAVEFPRSALLQRLDGEESARP